VSRQIYQGLSIEKLSASFVPLCLNMATLYKWQPLRPGEIRLVELQPRPLGGKLIRRIRHVSLADDPAYECISYSWQGDGATETVICEEPRTALKVPPNLKAALTHLARIKKLPDTESPTGASEPCRLLWMDAISISQEDKEEKGAQVRMMTDIFRKAQRVQVWVGEEQKDDDKAFDLIKRLIRASEIHGNSGHKISIANILPQDRGTFFGLTNSWEDMLYIEASIVAFLKMVDRSWFSRVWCVQEVAVSKDAWLRCGRHSTHWESFVRAVRYSIDARLRPLEGYGRELALKIAQAREDYQNSAASYESDGRRKDLQRLLFRFHDFASTEAVDKIYALLGLSTNSGPDGLKVEVDYNTSKEKTYTTVAQNILLLDRNLDIFGACHGDPEPEAPSALPSWVPDWSTTGKHIPLRLQGSSQEKYVHFAASANYIDYEPAVDGKRLRLNGFLFDEITALSLPVATRVLPPKETSGLRGISRDLLNELYRWHIMFGSIENLLGLRSRNATYVTGESMFDVYWQTYICGCLEPEGYDRLRSWFHDKSKEGNWRHVPPPFIPRGSKPPVWIFALAFVVKMLWEAVKIWLRCIWCCFTCRVTRKDRHIDTLVSGKQEHMAYGQWRFARTSKGYAGLVPSSARVHDCVGLFKGGKVPLVLRKAATNEAEHFLVGECYIHGIMQGEAFSENKCGEVWIS
jgi:hypothetical protein